MLLAAQPPDAARERVSLRIAGRVVRFEPADSGVVFSVHGVRSSFLVADDLGADCVVTCEFGDPTPDRSPVISAASPLWEQRRRETGEDEITFYAPTGRDRIPWAQLIIEPSFQRARLIHVPNWGGSKTLRVGYPVDEVLMCRLLVSQGILVVHGATVEYDGMALLFTGHSGAGKSTLAAIAEAAGAQVLSDDRSIVGVSDSAGTVWGTPWHGTHRRGSATPAQLTAMFLLIQDGDDRVSLISPARAAGELLVRLIHPGAHRGDMERLFDSVTALVERVPMGELRFRPTERAFHLAADFARNTA